MNIILQRMMWRDCGIFSNILDENNNEICISLEHAFPSPDGQSVVPKIPTGVYICQRRLSPKFGYEVFQVLDVPGATFVEIHRGNFNKDSEGCILLGEKVEQYGGSLMISNSQDAFDAFMLLQDGLDSFTLTVE